MDSMMHTFVHYLQLHMYTPIYENLCGWKLFHIIEITYISFFYLRYPFHWLFSSLSYLFFLPSFILLSRSTVLSHGWHPSAIVSIVFFFIILCSPLEYIECNCLSHHLTHTRAHLHTPIHQTQYSSKHFPGLVVFSSKAINETTSEVHRAAADKECT